MRALFLGLSLLAAAAAAAQEPVTLSPPSLPADARFGAALAISPENQAAPNDVIVVAGAPGGTYEAPPSHPGTAFSYVGRQWDAPRPFVSPDPQSGDLFGFSVYRNRWEFYGTLIGAPGADAAYHFHKTAFSTVDYVTRLNGSSVGSGSGFGYAVTALGGNLTVGAPFAAGGGAVLVFPEYSPSGVPASVNPTATLRPSVNTDTRFGAAVTIAGSMSCQPYCDFLVVGAPGTDGGDGAVYVFGQNGSGAWVEETRLTGPPGFGTHVAAAYQYGLIAVTVPGSDTSAGALYVYREGPARQWTLAATYEGSGPRYPGSLAFWSHSPPYWDFLTGAPGDSPEAAPLPVGVFNAGGTRIDEIDSPSGASPAFGASVAFRILNSGQTIWAVGDPERGPGTVTLGTSSISVASEEGAPTLALRLSAPVPNPASGTATVRLDVPTAADVRVALYDVLGREVAVVHEGPLAAGAHTLTVEGGRLPAGAYVLRATADGASVTRHLTLAH